MYARFQCANFCAACMLPILLSHLLEGHNVNLQKPVHWTDLSRTQSLFEDYDCLPPLVNGCSCSFISCSARHLFSSFVSGPLALVPLLLILLILHALVSLSLSQWVRPVAGRLGTFGSEDPDLKHLFATRVRKRDRNSLHLKIKIRPGGFAAR